MLLLFVCWSVLTWVQRQRRKAKQRQRHAGDMDRDKQRQAVAAATRVTAGVAARPQAGGLAAHGRQTRTGRCRRVCVCGRGGAVVLVLPWCLWCSSREWPAPAQLDSGGPSFSGWHRSIPASASPFAAFFKPSSYNLFALCFSQTSSPTCRLPQSSAAASDSRPLSYLPPPLLVAVAVVCSPSPPAQPSPRLASPLQNPPGRSFPPPNRPCSNPEDLGAKRSEPRRPYASHPLTPSSSFTPSPFDLNTHAHAPKHSRNCVLVFCNNR